MAKELKFRRRKADRPQEIVDAATEVFAEKGFAASKLEEIAARAGVSKGTLYLYYATKEALFEAVVKSFASTTVSEVRGFIAGFEGSFAELLACLLTRAAQSVGASRVPAVAKMVIGEARNFPDLARVWRRELVEPVMSALSERVRRAQKAGEVEAGSPELYAMSITSPLLVAMLLREVFGDGVVSAAMLSGLAEIHSRTLVRGMVAPNRLVSSKTAKKERSR